MEALLRLGQRDLEAAKFQTARGWLNEAAMHIDLDTRRAAHCHFMLGLIGQYLDDPAAVADSLAMLAELGPEAEQFQVQLEQLAALNERPAMNPAITVLQRGQASDLNDLVGQAIWSVSLEESLTRRWRAAANEAEEAENDGIPRVAARRERGREANLTTAACTVVDEVVYVNEGHHSGPASADRAAALVVLGPWPIGTVRTIETMPST